MSEHITVSWVSFTDANIRDVASYLNIPEEQVRAYLADGSVKNDAIHNAFYRVVGIYPARLASRNHA